MKKKVVISDCGKYRYRLVRQWNDNLHTVVFFMLNPSTADAEEDDPTIRRCIGLAKSWGYGGILVINLFAYRATDPLELKSLTEKERLGEDNIKHIKDVCNKFNDIVLAWGNSISKCKIQLPTEIIDNIPLSKIYHIGLTSSGRPKHPLFAKSDVKPIKYFK